MKHLDIDFDTWDRKDLFIFYEDYDMPYIIMTANTDVTAAYDFAKKHNISFNLVMVYICTKVCDSIINFRYRFKDGKPFLIGYNRPEINHIIPGNERFVTGSGPWPCDDIVEFCRITHENLNNAGKDSFKEAVQDKSDIINYSPIPWVQFTHMFRTIAKGGQDNNPKISFGRYFDQDGRKLMPIAVQVHHALMDGYHVGKFYNGIQKEIDQLSDLVSLK